MTKRKIVKLKAPPVKKKVPRMLTRLSGGRKSCIDCGLSIERMKEGFISPNEIIAQQAGRYRIRKLQKMIDNARNKWKKRPFKHKR